MVSNRVPAPPRGALARGAGLPTLVPGRDRLPTSCPYCGSGWFDNEPPLGPHQRGSLWCLACSRTLCWLAAPLGSLTRAARTPPISRELVTAQTRLPPIRRRIIAADFGRGAGCGATCTVDYGHDPSTHEHHGANAAYAELRARRSGDVVTGPLLVQLGPGRVYVAGREVPLAPLPFAILAHLAERLGDLCELPGVVADVWERAYTTGAPASVSHTLRVYVSRLRASLGQAGALIETETGRGYRLRDEPPC